MSYIIEKSENLFDLSIGNNVTAVTAINMANQDQKTSASTPQCSCTLPKRMDSATSLTTIVNGDLSRQSTSVIFPSSITNFSPHKLPMNQDVILDFSKANFTIGNNLGALFSNISGGVSIKFPQATYENFGGGYCYAMLNYSQQAGNNYRIIGYPWVWKDSAGTVYDTPESCPPQSVSPTEANARQISAYSFYLLTMSTANNKKVDNDSMLFVDGVQYSKSDLTKYVAESGFTFTEGTIGGNNTTLKGNGWSAWYNVVDSSDYLYSNNLDTNSIKKSTNYTAYYPWVLNLSLNPAGDNLPISIHEQYTDSYLNSRCESADTAVTTDFDYYSNGAEGCKDVTNDKWNAFYVLKSANDVMCLLYSEKTETTDTGAYQDIVVSNLNGVTLNDISAYCESYQDGSLYDVKWIDKDGYVKTDDGTSITYTSNDGTDVKSWSYNKSRSTTFTCIKHVFYRKVYQRDYDEVTYTFNEGSGQVSIRPYIADEWYQEV